MKIELMRRGNVIEVKINKARIIDPIVNELYYEFGGSPEKIYELLYSIFNEWIGSKKDSEAFNITTNKDYGVMIEEIISRFRYFKEELIKQGGVMIPDVVIQI